MASQVNVNTTNNQVTVTQGTTQIVTVSAQGPQGVQGPVGATGPSGSIPNTGSFATTGSNSFIGNQIITGSLIISGSSTFTNIGPASFSGSTSITGSLNVTGSIVISGSGQVITSLDTGSFITNSDTGSFITNSDTGSFITNSQTGSFATTGSNSFTGSLDVSGSLTITGSLTVSGSGTFTNIGPFNQTGESLFIGNITSSGNISASGDIIGGGLNINGTTTFNDGNITNIGGIQCDSIVDDATNGTGMNLNPSDIRFRVAEVLNVFTIGASGNVTASGNISASGDIVGNNLSGTNTGDQDLSSLVTNSSTASFAITGSNVLFGNITSSGNISASSTIIANGLDIRGSGNATTFNDANITNVGQISLDSLISDGGGDNQIILNTADMDHRINDSGVMTLKETAVEFFNDGTVGHITASGNISSSGQIIGDGSGLTNLQRPITTHTANFSASAIYAGNFNIVGGSLTCSISTSAAAVGAEWEFFQTSSAGNFLFETGSGITMFAKDGNLKLAGQSSAATLKKISADSFALIGDLTS